MAVSVTFLEVLFLEDKAIVIISDIPENEGRSVVNGYEYMASQVYNKYLLDYLPEQVLWIEHDVTTRNYASVRLTAFKEELPPFLRKSQLSTYRFLQPNWKHIPSVEAIRKLVTAENKN